MNKRRFFKNSFDSFLFRDGTLMVVAATVSLLLQIISFFTTFDGAKAYFEATFELAPLFFALAVQAVVYFLENGIRRRVTPAKVTALTLAIICSSYFSFVGIYNNINPPERYLEQTYTTYAGELNTALSELEYDTNSSASADVNKAVNGIISEYASLTSELDILDSLSEQISAAQAQDSLGMAAPRRGDYYEYEDYAAAYSAYIASLSQSRTAEQQGQIAALLAKYGISDSSELNAKKADITAQLSLISGTLSATSGDFYAKAENARNVISSGKNQQLAERVFTLYSSLSGERLSVPSALGQEEISLDLPEFSEISAGMPAAAARERLSSEISAACDLLISAGCELNRNDFYFENIYTLPIYSVMEEVNTDAVVALLLAVLTDLLSLLFAMIFVKQRSILAATDTEKAVTMRDSLFEQNILTAVQLGICAEGGSFSDGWSSRGITERLARFVGCFRAEDFAAEQGFSLIAERDSLEGFDALTAFLCQFGLAKTISAKDAEMLTNGSITAPSVLLKTKFLMWVSEKFCSPDIILDREADNAVSKAEKPAETAERLEKPEQTGKPKELETLEDLEVTA